VISLALDAAFDAEHFRSWGYADAGDVVRGKELRVFRGVERSTDIGQIRVLDVEECRSGVLHVSDLRRYLRDQRDMMIATPPFRHVPCRNSSLRRT
jgi:hypothetical protein